MKKITFILFALITGTTFAQDADANAAAEIVSPITIAKATDLNFGRISNSEAGTVVVESDGTYTESTLAQISGGDTPAAATFTVNAADGFTYAVELPTSTTLTNGSTTLTVDAFTSDAGATPTGNGADQTIGVGATLNVSEGQSTGIYSGTFNVSVSYN